MSDIAPHIQERLLLAARSVAQRAYAPYSRYRVGAAVLTGEGEVFTGCNVENASYGLTVCAERAAVATAVAVGKHDRLRIQALAVVTLDGAACAPCGACRQVILEFGPDALILFAGEGGRKLMSIQELLPESFSSEKLKRAISNKQ
jgi:cytidine deaminase